MCELGPSSPLRSLFAAKLVGRSGDGPRFAGAFGKSFAVWGLPSGVNVYLPHIENICKNRCILLLKNAATLPNKTRFWGGRGRKVT